jgi:hypothetical protein
MNRTLPALLVAVLGVLIGGLLDLAFGPILSVHTSSQEPPWASPQARAGRENSNPMLAGTSGRAVEPTGRPTGGPPLREASPAENRPAHPPSSLPPGILDVYAELDQNSYRRLLAPVRLYSVLDDIEVAVGQDDGPVEVAPLEAVAHAAALRRGEARLPANGYMALGIPIGLEHHELLIGVLPETDAGSAEQVLQRLAREAGLDARRFQGTDPAYVQALAVAETYVQDRIKFRCREQALLARWMSEPGGRYGGLPGRWFAVLPGGKRVVVMARGADAELDALLAAYVRAPEAERAALRRMHAK